MDLSRGLGDVYKRQVLGIELILKVLRLCGLWIKKI
jgi:hypothetical protein